MSWPKPPGSGVGAVSGAGILTKADVAAWPMRLPTLSASPPTFVAGTANAATAISGSVGFSVYDRQAFTILGGPGLRGSSYPNARNLGQYPQITSASPTAIEFWFTTSDSTGRFEVTTYGNGGSLRLLVRNPSGQWEYATSGASITHASDGNGYLDLATLGAPGTYLVRIETYNVRIGQMRAGPTDTFRATDQKRRRILAVGDSFTEPTISESGTSTPTGDGWPQLLAYLTNIDIWSAGSGQTGWVNPGSGRVKFRDRLAQDVIAFAPDGIIWAGGINDIAYDPATVQSEVAACIAQVKAALPNCEHVVLSPFFPRGILGMPGTLYAVRDAIKASAIANGVRYLDFIQATPPAFLSDYGDSGWNSTLQASAANSATSIVVGSVPAYFLQSGVAKNEWWVLIGSGSTQTTRKVTNISGSTGAYTLTLSSSITAYAAGVPVALGGESYVTGTGKQGSPTSDGNADVMTGSDGTHPTKAGHAHIARVVASTWANSIAGR